MATAEEMEYGIRQMVELLLKGSAHLDPALRDISLRNLLGVIGTHAETFARLVDNEIARR